MASSSSSSSDIEEPEREFNLETPVYFDGPHLIVCGKFDIGGRDVRTAVFLAFARLCCCCICCLGCYGFIMAAIGMGLFEQDFRVFSGLENESYRVCASKCGAGDPGDFVGLDSINATDCLGEETYKFEASYRDPSNGYQILFAMLIVDIIGLFIFCVSVGYDTLPLCTCLCPRKRTRQTWRHVREQSENLWDYSCCVIDILAVIVAIILTVIGIVIWFNIILGEVDKDELRKIYKVDSQFEDLSECIDPPLSVETCDRVYWLFDFEQSSPGIHSNIQVLRESCDENKEFEEAVEDNLLEIWYIGVPLLILDIYACLLANTVLSLACGKVTVENGVESVKTQHKDNDMPYYDINLWKNAFFAMLCTPCVLFVEAIANFTETKDYLLEEFHDIMNITTCTLWTKLGYGPQNVEKVE